MNRFQKDAMHWFFLRNMLLGGVLGGALAAALLVLLSGCTGQHRAPQTAYESMLVAAEYGRAMTSTVNELRATGAIAPAQHLQMLDTLQEALDATERGLEYYQIGEAALAEQGAARAEALMRILAVMVIPYLPDTPQNEAFKQRYGGAP